MLGWLSCLKFLLRQLEYNLLVKYNYLINYLSSLLFCTILFETLFILWITNVIVDKKAKTTSDRKIIRNSSKSHWAIITTIIILRIENIIIRYQRKAGNIEICKIFN